MFSNSGKANLTATIARRFIRITISPPAAASTADTYAAESIYLFERLTRLPAAAYGEEINGVPIAKAKAQLN